MILGRPLPTTHNETKLAGANATRDLEDELNNRLQTNIAILRLAKTDSIPLRLLFHSGRQASS